MGKGLLARGTSGGSLDSNTVSSGRRSHSGGLIEANEIQAIFIYHKFNSNMELWSINT